jgi:hypothetical protein
MVIVAKYELIENPQKGVFVRSEEQSICPSCHGRLKVRGSRQRRYINSTGETIVLVIRGWSALIAGRYITNSRIYPGTVQTLCQRVYRGRGEQKP